MTQIGQLKTRVEIVPQWETKNQLGEVETLSLVGFFRFGSVKATAKAETIENETMTNRNTVEITFRYDKKITEECILHIKGKTFEVVSVVDKDMTSRWLTVTAMEVQ